MQIFRKFSASWVNAAAASYFISGLQRQNKSPHTIVNYQQDLKRFLSWLERHRQRKLWRISPRDIGDYLEYLGSGETPLAVASRKRHLSTLRNFYEYLIQSHWRPYPWPWPGMAKNSPILSKVHYLKLKDSDRTPTPMLPHSEWQRLEEHSAKIQDKLALALLYYGGLRLRELAPLRWENFSLGRRSLTVTRKGGKVQELPLQHFDLIWDLAQKTKNKQMPQSPYLFPGRDKALGARALYARIKNAIVRARTSPSLSPHSFRKACATQLYLKTKDLLLVRDYLNHRDAKVTQTYIDPITLEQARSNHGDVIIRH